MLEGSGYIAFEGLGGSGKTFQSQQLVSRLKETHPDRKVIWIKEPGGSEIADTVRTVVQETKFTEVMHPLCEVYLYAAARAQMLTTVGKPLLNRGGTLVSDRCFFSSLVYQGYCRGLDWQIIRDINRPVIREVYPDLIIYLDMDVDTALARRKEKSEHKFATQSRNFFVLAAQGYLEIGRQFSNFKVVNARGSRETVAEQVWQVIST